MIPKWVRLTILGGGFVVLMLLVALGVWADAHEKEKNYLYVDSAEVDVAVRIDGEPIIHEGRVSVGPSAVNGKQGRPMLRTSSLKPGKHTVEIITGAGPALETATIDVPATGYRGVYVVGEQREYALVSIGYGSAKPTWPDLAPLVATATPHLFELPKEVSINNRTFGAVNGTFPATVSTKGPGLVLVNLCTMTDDVPDCPEG